MPSNIDMKYTCDNCNFKTNEFTDMTNHVRKTKHEMTRNTDHSDGIGGTK